MSEKIGAVNLFALTVAVMLPTAASADDRFASIAVPVRVSFGNYKPAYEALDSAISTKLLRSQLVTPNVDAYRALYVEVRLTRVRGSGQLATVIYSWDRMVISRMRYPCARAQIARCSTAIVKGAERSSYFVRRSSSWHQ